MRIPFPFAALLMLAAAQSAVAADLRLPAGTPLKLQLKSPLGSIHSKPGDRFYLAVVDPVAVEGQVLIPAGSRAVGEVARVQRKGDFGKSGKLVVTLSHVMAGLRPVPIRGRMEANGAEADAAEVALGVVLLSGLMTGRSAAIAPGTIFEAVTSEDVVLVPASN
jgi:hypothetical protein